ncbi:MAG: hypothetical protein GX786_01845 [Clostridiales bacterium]|nr:hypothetical protein [Clostridiales bacterium]
MKKNLVLLVIIFACMFVALSTTAETIKVNHIATDDGYRLFVKNHPDIEIIWDEKFYFTKYELSNALLTGELDSDVFFLSTYLHDCRTVMEKEYCLDLSGSEIINNEIKRLWTSIENQLVMDNKIFAIPIGIGFDYYYCNPEAWEIAQLEVNDIPKSFPEFLDFLDKWIIRMENDSENISIKYNWDETLYTEYSYAQWLIEEIITNHIMQSQYKRIPLRFDDPELVELLERAKNIGYSLYSCDPAYKGSLQLFESPAQNSWKGDMKNRMLSLRINKNQPHLIAATLDMVVINPETMNKDLALELLENQISHLDPFIKVYLYQDAEPLKNTNYESDIATQQAFIDENLKQLENPDLDVYEKEDLEISLKNRLKVMESIKTREYLVSAEKLEDYKFFADSLYFLPPSIFISTTKEGQTVLKLKKNYATGSITTQEFVNELNRIAQMIEMEME